MSFITRFKSLIFILFVFSSSLSSNTKAEFTSVISNKDAIFLAVNEINSSIGEFPDSAKIEIEGGENDTVKVSFILDPKPEKLGNTIVIVIDKRTGEIVKRIVQP